MPLQDVDRTAMDDARRIKNSLFILCNYLIINNIAPLRRHLGEGIRKVSNKNVFFKTTANPEGRKPMRKSEKCRAGFQMSAKMVIFV